MLKAFRVKKKIVYKVLSNCLTQVLEYENEKAERNGEEKRKISTEKKKISTEIKKMSTEIKKAAEFFRERRETKGLELIMGNHERLSLPRELCQPLYALIINVHYLTILGYIGPSTPSDFQVGVK